MVCPGASVLVWEYGSECAMVCPGASDVHTQVGRTPGGRCADTASSFRTFFIINFIGGSVIYGRWACGWDLHGKAVLSNHGGA